jgi:hypothetical protein
MKDPHYEDDSQDWHCINLTQFETMPKSILALRIFYYQSSPNWISFYLKSIVCLVSSSLTAFLGNEESNQSNVFDLISAQHRSAEGSDNQHKNPRDIEDIFSLSYEHEKPKY